MTKGVTVCNSYGWNCTEIGLCDGETINGINCTRQKEYFGVLSVTVL